MFATTFVTRGYGSARIPHPELPDLPRGLLRSRTVVKQDCRAPSRANDAKQLRRNSRCSPCGMSVDQTERLGEELSWLFDSTRASGSFAIYPEKADRPPLQTRDRNLSGSGHSRSPRCKNRAGAEDSILSAMRRCAFSRSIAVG